MLKKKRKDLTNKSEISKLDGLHNEVEDGFGEQNAIHAAGEKKDGKLDKKRRKNKKLKKAKMHRFDKICNVAEDSFGEDKVKDCCDEQNVGHTEGENKDSKSNKKRRKIEKLKKAQISKFDEPSNVAEEDFKEGKGKSSKAYKDDQVLSKKEQKSPEMREEAEQNEIYEISSDDADCSRGIRKWITEYHGSRPGLKILQERIDDFITAYEEQEEKARKEREALAAEGGWTVVVHHKGRKKTTDAESGITVGSVAQAAVLENMGKKKNKVGLDFYRFQKREAQRNEILEIQSKFEQDKKRIQQLRAARKFWPY